jgi:hypothetical protein
MSEMSIAEVVDKLEKARTKSERLDILKANDCGALRGILRMNFDASLKLALPEGTPPFKKSASPVGFGDTTLKASAKGWYVFSKELAPSLTQTKRESIFISLLEKLDAREAEILLSAKDKKLDLGLTKKLIDEVFPGLIRSESTKNGGKKESAKTTNTSSTKSDGESV